MVVEVVVAGRVQTYDIRLTELLPSSNYADQEPQNALSHISYIHLIITINSYLNSLLLI